MKVKAFVSKRLFRITVMRGPLQGQTSLEWMTLMRAREHGSDSYKIEEVANCAELKEEMRYQAGVISWDDISDALIDLHRAKF